MGGAWVTASSAGRHIRCEAEAELSPNADGQVRSRIDFYSDVLTPELLGDRRSRPASEKRIEHNSSCRGPCEYARLDQIGWEGRKVRSFV